MLSFMIYFFISQSKRAIFCLLRVDQSEMSLFIWSTIGQPIENRDNFPARSPIAMRIPIDNPTIIISAQSN